MAEFNNYYNPNNMGMGMNGYPQTFQQPIPIPGVPTPNNYPNPYQSNIGLGYNNVPTYGGWFNGAFVPNNSMNVPKVINILNNDAIKQLMANPQKNLFDLNITEEDLLRSYCYHNDNTRSVIMQTKDGECYCPICQAKFRAEAFTDEEINNAIKTIDDALQQIKLSGQVPTGFGQDYFSIIPMIHRIPDLYKFSNKNMEKFYNNNMYSVAGDISSNAIYDNLNRRYSPIPQVGYYDPQQQMGYYQQNNMQQQPMMATNVNPMQVPYGFNQQAPNQQFVAQGNMMMGGQQMMNPNYPIQQIQQQPVQQQQTQSTQQQPVQQQQTQSTQQQPVQQQQTPIITESGQLTL